MEEQQTDSMLKICLRRGRKLPKAPGSRLIFRKHCETIARSLGTPIWPDQHDVGGVVTTIEKTNHPTFHYTPPIAFITFQGDFTQLQQILDSDPELRPTINQGDCDKWTISRMEKSKVPKTIPNAFNHIRTGHRALWVPEEDKNTASSTTTTSTLQPQTQAQTQAQTQSIQPIHQEGPPKATLVVINLTKPSNLGSIYRNMSCFGIDDVIHVYKNGVAPPEWKDQFRMQQIKALSRGTDEHATRTLIPMNEYVGMLKRTRKMETSSSSSSSSSTNASLEPSAKRAKLEQVDRPPIVAIETATGAVNITSFQFPKRCTIMVGSEGSGISPKVLRAMVPGYDSFVVIPMHGKHHSLNVSMAAGIALYEYRRQWPK